jgi:hypothetical protein
MEKSEAIAECTCPMCPTYVNCGETVAYCLPDIGRSKCIADEKACICPLCPVQIEMGFTRDYYCIYGADAQQAGKSS